MIRRDWSDEIKERIRRRYARLDGEPYHPSEAVARVEEAGYPRSVLDRLPPEMLAAWRGCGFPLAGICVAGVRVAVDLGCGAGIDAWWLASQIGRNGIVVALDMTVPMLGRLAKLPVHHAPACAPVTPVAGDMERLPLRSGIADLVIANASFNLTVDKAQSFSEAYRVLKPGGRLAVRELVRERELPREILEDPLADVTSLGGTVTEETLASTVARAGFADVRITDHRPFSCVLSVRLDAVKPLPRGEGPLSVAPENQRHE